MPRGGRSVAFPQGTVAIGVLAACLLVTLPDVFALGDHHVKSHSRVVVIGGGVVGVSTLYHLALKGWSDAVRLERAELTAGSTWPAAGLLPLLNVSHPAAQRHKYSVDLKRRLPGETGQDVSFHATGNWRLAPCRDR